MLAEFSITRLEVVDRRVLQYLTWLDHSELNDHLALATQFRRVPRPQHGRSRRICFGWSRRLALLRMLTFVKEVGTSGATTGTRGGM